MIRLQLSASLPIPFSSFYKLDFDYSAYCTFIMVSSFRECEKKFGVHFMHIMFLWKLYCCSVAVLRYTIKSFESIS